MKMSTKGRYGLRVMMALANHYGRGPLPVETIAANQDISARYIHILVMSLRAAGLVRTVRGAAGGCELSRPPAEITALDVVSAMEGQSRPAECVADPSACQRSGACAAREVWCEVAAAVDAVLSGLTLEELAARQRARAGEPINYVI